jgi:hypothetical protein
MFSVKEEPNVGMCRCSVLRKSLMWVYEDVQQGRGEQVLVLVKKIFLAPQQEQTS